MKSARFVGDGPQDHSTELFSDLDTKRTAGVSARESYRTELVNAIWSKAGGAWEYSKIQSQAGRMGSVLFAKAARKHKWPAPHNLLNKKNSQARR